MEICLFIVNCKVCLKETHVERCTLLGFNSGSVRCCRVAETHAIQYVCTLQRPGRPFGLIDFTHEATIARE